MEYKRFEIVVSGKERTISFIETAQSEIQARSQAIRYLNALDIRVTVKTFKINQLSTNLNGTKPTEQPSVCEV